MRVFPGVLVLFPQLPRQIVVEGVHAGEIEAHVLGLVFCSRWFLVTDLASVD